MTSREKKLSSVIALVALLFAGTFGLRAFLLKPLRTIDAQSESLRERLARAKKERMLFFKDEQTLKEFAQQAFADDLERASAFSGSNLTQQILLSGLREADFSRLPLGTRKLRGASEIGWSVQGGGPLDKILNLLFLLQETPRLQRLDTLSFSPADENGQVKIRFRYLALVLQPAPEPEPSSTNTLLTLQSPHRQLYNPILQRDLLRPFTPPTPPPPAPTPPTTPPPPSAPGPETFRVVSLSEWNGQSEVHVRDATRQTTSRFSTGDPLAGGAIVMIDYRPLPLHGHESLLSFSRVIIKIDKTYWAIDQGQTLAQKYQLKPELIPAQLSKL